MDPTISLFRLQPVYHGIFDQRLQDQFGDYQQNGRIVPTSATYKQIESLTLQKYFPGFYYDYKQNLQTVEALTKQLEEIIRYTKAIETENKRLKTEITSFKK